MLDIPREWSFENSSVASEFDKHVREQLPWYDLATNAISAIARNYIPRRGLVYDIGASTGNIGAAISSILVERQARLFSIESSLEMANKYQGPQPENLIICDATTAEIERFDLAVCFLTIMFMPINTRALFIERLRSLLNPGGAIIIFDKTESGAGYIGTVMWRLTLAGKVAADVPATQIVAKELSLSGVQRPLKKCELPENAVEWFRFGEFAGWIIE